jgi:hypothetical protein
MLFYSFSYVILPVCEQVDLSVLFKSRQPSMPNEEAARLAEDWNEDLEKMEVGASSRDFFPDFYNRTLRRPERGSREVESKTNICVTVD